MFGSPDYELCKPSPDKLSPEVTTNINLNHSSFPNNAEQYIVVFEEFETNSHDLATETKLKILLVPDVSGA
jgi:hypothetical protein